MAETGNPFARHLIALRNAAVEATESQTGAAASAAVHRLLEQELDNLSRVHASRGAPPLACREGCAFCCLQPVALTIDELAELMEAVTRIYSPEEILDLKIRLEAWWSAFESAVPAGTASVEPPKFRRMCPLNREGSCSVYEARPITCRTFTSFDAGRCEQQLGEGLNVAVPAMPFVAEVGGAVGVGHQIGMLRIGLPARLLALVPSLLHALEHPGSVERALSGSDEFRAFAIAGSDVSLEAESQLSPLPPKGPA